MTWQRVFENPRSPRAQLEALVWKHTSSDYRGKREDGTKVILVNTGAGPFRGHGSYGTEPWPLSSLTVEQLCYQLPRSVRAQHPELCGLAENPRPPRAQLEGAVRAWQLYMGSEGLPIKAQQRFYDKAMKLTAQVDKKLGSPYPSVHQQITDEARRRGKISPQPGKDY